jgi:hypothetical protein
MLTLLFILIGIIALLIFLLAVPIDLEYQFDNQLEKKSSTRIIWLFGLVNVELKKHKHDIELKKSKIPKAKKKRKTTANVKSNIRPFLVVIKSEGFLKRILKLFREMLTVAEIRQLQARLGFGLGDPAETGQLYGMVSPMFVFMYAMPGVNFVVIPIFDRTIFQVEISAALRIVPLRFVRAILYFIFSIESLRAIKAAIKARK